MAADPADVVIPADLLPADGRFGSGPSKVRAEQVTALAAVSTSYLGTSHRQKTVKSQVGRVRAGLGRAVRAPRRLRGRPRQRRLDRVLGRRDLRPHRGPCAVPHLRRVRLEVRPAATKAPHLGDPTVRTAPRPVTRRIRRRARRRRLRDPHNETSTGVAITPTRVTAPTRSLMVFDATSAPAGCTSTRPFDTYYFAPQKSFGSDGGMWFALMSPAAVERVERMSPPALGPRLPRPHDRAGQQPARPDVQHPGARRRSCSWPSRSTGSTSKAASTGA